MLNAAIRVGVRTAHFGGQHLYSISNWKLPAFEIDTSGISGFMQSKTEAYMSLSQKLGELGFTSMYTGLDEWTRELVLSLSTDLGCGFGLSIMLSTIVIKTIFLYPTLRGQLQALRQKEIKQLSKRFQQKMKAAQMSRNKLLMSQAQYQYKMAMKKLGINNTVPLLNLLQIPILLTWFFSLRYMSNLPELYPQMLTEGLFWFTDLSTYDPYFVLPVAAACLTSLSIVRSPNFAKKNVAMPMLAPFIPYLRYLPFASLAFTTFFPASINLYWFTLAGYQVLMTEMMHMKSVRSFFSTQKKKQINTRLNFDGAVFVNEKKSSGQIMDQAQKISQVREQLVESVNKKGQQLNIKDVKVSFKKIKKQKKQVPKE